MSLVLQGKPVADAIYADVRARVERLHEERPRPKLAIVRVGDNPSDVAYERTITKRAEEVDIRIDARHLESDVSRFAVESILEGINVDRTVDACLLFRPLPEQMDETALCNMLAPEKDVDGIGATSLAGVFMNLPEGFAPCTAEACIALLDHYGIALEGAHVVVVGRSLVVGKPVAMLALGRNATVTVCHSNTVGLSDIMRAADIVICATGCPRTFGAESFAEGQVVLDVGTSMDAQGKLAGDVDFEAVEPIVSAITPVPGGIGAVTTAILARHVVCAAERNR